MTPEEMWAHSQHWTHESERLLERGQLDAARDGYQQALGWLSRLVEAQGRSAPPGLYQVAATLLRNIGFVYQQQGDLDQALQHLRQALEIDQGIDPRSTDTARDLNNIGFTHQRQGDLEEALKHYGQALEILQRIDPRSTGTAACLRNMGVLYRERGDLEQALNYYRQALEIDQQIAPQSTDMAECLNNIACIYWERGDLEQALSYYREALEIGQQVAPRSIATAVYLDNLGSVYMEQGDLERALRYCQQALEIDQQIAPESIDTAVCLDNLGVLCHRRGDLEQALKHHRQALSIMQRTAPRSAHTATCLNNVGALYRKRGDLEQALDYYRHALEIHQQIAPRSRGTATALNNIGCIYSANHKLEQALDYCRQALEIDQQIGPWSMEKATDLNDIGGIYQQLGDLDNALSYCKRAVEVMEDLRTRAGGAHARAGFFARPELRRAYQRLAACLFKRGRSGDHADAFHYAERSHARALVDLLAESKIEVRAGTSEQQALLDEERALQSRLAATVNSLTALRADPLARPTLLRELDAQEQQTAERLDSLRARIRAMFPQYAQIQYPDPLTLEQVQHQVLDPATLLLEYDASGDQPFVWAVRQNAFQMLPLSVSADELTALVTQAVQRFHRDRPTEVQRAKQEAEQTVHARLGEALLEIVPNALWEGVTRLLIVPDGPLHYLPFEVLPSRGRLLADSYLLAYAPSATVLDHLRQLWDRRPAPEPGSGYRLDFLGFGDPAFPYDTDEQGDSGADGSTPPPGTRGLRLIPLPGTREEVETVQGLFDSRGNAFFGLEATEHKVRALTEGCRYVHFATHGIFNEARPLYSGLALAPPQSGEPKEGDYLLQVYEMFSLRLQAELVVCSACETGLGKLQAGEGLVGMSRALFFAGARCLLVSLWKVDDQRTKEFMVCFYRALREGKSTLEALGVARRRMREDIWDDPYYWAAFIPIGLPT